MKEIGFGLIIVSLAVIFLSYMMPTTVFDTNTYNIGMLQNQQSVLLIGLFLFLSSIILICAGYIKESIESQNKIDLKELESTSFDDTKKAVRFGSYLICPKCNKANPSDFKKCRYCDTKLIAEDYEESKVNFSSAK